MNWGPIMKHINESPHDFFQGGGWSFLRTADGVVVSLKSTLSSRSDVLVRTTALMKKNPNQTLLWRKMTLRKRMTTAVRATSLMPVEAKAHPAQQGLTLMVR